MGAKGYQRFPRFKPGVGILPGPLSYQFQLNRSIYFTCSNPPPPPPPPQTIPGGRPADFVVPPPPPLPVWNLRAVI